MKRRRGRRREGFRELVATSEERDSDSEGERDESDSRATPPWRSIALASTLFLVGVVLLLGGALQWAGLVNDDENKGTPMIIVGSICFIPGFYIVLIGYYAWRGNYGFSYHDIPS